jgi:hypothetical protein
MFAGQDELCFAVVEPRGWAPASHRVTGKTSSRKLAAVLIQMAARAAGLQPQESLLEVFLLVYKFSFVPDESGLVAGLAF